MKKILLILVLLVCCFLLIMESASAQNIGINATGAAPAASAMLDISATNKGLLIPQVALTATNTAGPVTSPATSLLVYNTATAGSSPNNVIPGYYYWNGSAWIVLNSSSNLSAWKATGNAGTTAGANFVGNTDSVDLVLKTNNKERARISAAGKVGIGSSAFDATNPEKLIVNSGVTSSVNAIVGKGSINNYLQLNIQNQSTGTSASSDVVATANNGSETTNYIDMGINGSAYTAGVVGGANDAYLYNLGQNLLVGTGTAGKSLILVAGGTNIATSERLRIDGSTGNIGIGTTTPQARLDIASTTGGLLMPRMTTAQRDAITSPPLSSYIYNTTTNCFNVYVGTGWKSLGYSSSTQIVVTSLADLPTPASGAITLDATKDYQFEGIIDIGGNYINLNGATVRGSDLGDGVMSSVSGAVLRSTNQNIFLQNFVVVIASGSAKAYDFSDGTGLLSCVLQNANVADATPSLGVGQISGFTNVLIQNCGWQTADGLKLTGTMERFLFFGSLATNMTSGACIEFLSGIVLKDVNIGQSNFENSSTALKLDAGASIDIGRVASCILRNVTTPLTGFDSFTPGWEMTANSNIPNSRTYGYLYMNGNATATATSTTNTYVKVAGTTTATLLQKMTNPSSNRLTYIGKRSITPRVFIAVSGESPNNTGALSVALAKNGTVITSPRASITSMTSSQGFQLVLDSEVSLVTNDYLEVFIANNSGTSSYTIFSLQFRVVD